MRQYPLGRLVPLVFLTLVNLGVAAFVTVDLGRRLVPTPMPQGAAEVLSIPTLIPAPTPLPTLPPTAEPTPAVPTVKPTATPQRSNLPAVLVADDRFTYEEGFYADEIQAFLEEQDSVLARTTVPVGRGRDTVAHALSAHCMRYSLNPKVVLTLLEVQAGLVRANRASSERLRWAMGYHDPAWQGLERQLQWATYTLAEGFREAEAGEIPVLTDGTLAPIPAEANVATRAVLGMLSYTADGEQFSLLRSDGEGSFVQTYRELFKQDPRRPAEFPWEAARQPFLWPPFQGTPLISSYFDHEYPIFEGNGSLLSYAGQRGLQSYDGHDGWDYVLPAGTPVLAAAEGWVVFAGTVDTLCATPAGLIVLDHGRGYRTLYWHLQRIDVEEGAQVARNEKLGTVGSTGCSSGPHLHFGVQFLGRDTDPYGWCGSDQIVEDPWALHPAGMISRWLWADRPSPCPLPAGAVIVDEQGMGFTHSPTLWSEAPVGYGRHAFWTTSIDDARRSTHRAVWRPDLPEAGRYFLYAYIPWHDTGRPDTSEARYHIRHASGETTVLIDQANATGIWVPLGEFSFARGSKGYVYLDEVTTDPDTTVWFDAIVWVKE